MARISGINLPNDKRIEIALTYIFGIGKKTSVRILKETGINPETRVKDLTERDLSLLREKITKTPVEGELKRSIQLDIKRLQDIGSYRGFRHRKGLPVRGQHTKTNARTRKGKRKTVANKKAVTK